MSVFNQDVIIIANISFYYQAETAFQYLVQGLAVFQQFAVFCIKILGAKNHFVKFFFLQIHFLFIKFYFANAKFLVDINNLIFENFQSVHLLNFCTNIS